MRFWLTILVILVLFALTFRRRGPEFYVAAIIAGNTMLSIANLLLRGPFVFTSVDPVSVGIDFLSMIGLIGIALVANRMWPMLVAALQIIVMFAHASVLFATGWNQVYWGMMAVSQYLQLLTLAIGLIAHLRREKRIGRYRGWRHMRRDAENSRLRHSRRMHRLSASWQVHHGFEKAL